MITIISVMDGRQTANVARIGLAGAVLFTPDTFMDAASWAIFGVVFVATLRKVDPIWLIVLSGAAGYLIYG